MKLKIKKNPDNNFFQMARERLLQNNGYCPCAIEKTEEFKCPCKEFKEQDYEGLCYCGLLLKEYE